jgi:hypothetical protein
VTIDVPALSREFGTMPVFAVRLEIEACTVDSVRQWLPRGSYRRWLHDDHPQPLVPWTNVCVPVGWRARLSISGGLTDHTTSLLEQRLLP